MTYEELQDRLASIAEQEAALRTERKQLEHELAAAKVGRPYTGPVFGEDGERQDAAIEGATGSASSVGNAVN